MAGGTFKLSSPKVRPGGYVNIKNGKQPTASNAPSGIAIIPLIGYDWGPRGEMIHLTNESPDAAKVKFGRSIYDDNECMVMLQLMFLNATDVYTYIAGGGEKAKGTITLKSGTGNVTAKYPGTLGNKLKIVSVANPEGGFDVSVVLDGSEVELIEGATKVTDLKSDYVDFAGEGELAAFASASLTGGTNEESKVNASVATFLDMAEKIKFNYMALPTSEASLITAAVTKIKYIRNSIGWKCGLVVANSATDYENIYNLTNAAEYAGEELTIPQSAAWLAGALGGLCFLFCGSINEFLGWDMLIWKQMFICAVGITAIEFLSGYILNIVLRLGIWDYSNMPFNIIGQICLPFTVAWYILSLLAIVLDDHLRYWIFGEEKPRYKWR